MDIGIVCERCHTLNPLNTQVCTVCGVQLELELNFEEKARPSPRNEGPPMNICPNCHVELPQGFRFCGNCGHKLEIASEQPGESGARTIFFGAMQTPNRAKLILIKGEGLDGVAYHLNATEHVVGREEGAILFPEDPFLSPKHACFYYDKNTLVVRDEGSVNGVYVRLTNPVPLRNKTRFLIGEQLLEFESCSDEEGIPKTDVEGTYFYSSPKRPSRFKLIQILQGGEIGMIYRAPSDTVTLGREGNDINFPDDPYISGQHGRVANSPTGYMLADLGSKNGTFLRIEEPQRLVHGNYLFIGQQLLRVEIT